jgi:hypothetical protein
MKLLEIVQSPDPKKRYMAVFEKDDGSIKKVKFGDPTMESYIIHHDKDRRANYRSRHAKDLRTNDPTRAGFLSYFILWGKHKDINKNISSYVKKFGLDGHRGGATHRTNFIESHDIEDRGYNLNELSKISNVPRNILQEVYNRGIGAYNTNPSSVRMKGSYKKGIDAPMRMKLSKEQWAMARVYSFLDGNPKHDGDLRT